MGNNIFYSEMFIDKIIQQTNTNEHKIPYQMERMTTFFFLSTNQYEIKDTYIRFTMKMGSPQGRKSHSPDLLSIDKHD